MRLLSSIHRDEMGFFHQLNLLLWKNFTLKKRSPFVLLFELFIPLVLFVILLSIRKRQPPHPQTSVRWSPQPLPSSGAIPILQLFCEYNQHHNVTKEQSTYSFLNKLQGLGRKHHFFYPGYTPREMEQIPAIYKSIIDSPSTFQQSLQTAKNFRLSSLFTSNKSVIDYLHNNVSIPQHEIDVLFHSSVNVTEVYRLLFGSYPHIQDHTRVRRSLQKYGSDLQNLHENLKSSNFTPTDLLNVNDLISAAMSEFIPNFRDGLLHAFMNESALWEDKRLVQFILHYIDQTGSLSMPQSLSPTEIAEILKMILLSPQVLHEGACSAQELPKLLIPQSPANITDLIDIQHYLCNMTDDQFHVLSDLLKSQISDNKVVQLLQIKAVNISSLMSKVHTFLSDVDKFYTFQTTLYELSVLAEALPQDGCEMMSWENTTDTPPTALPSKAMPEDGSPDSPEVPKKNKFAGLIKFWDTMQKTLCGFEPPPTEEPSHVTTEATRLEHNTDKEPRLLFHRGKRSADEEEIIEENFDNLGLNSDQQKNLKILIHVLYSNPKILYAPNNTAAIQIIKKANATFELVDTINRYAREWLNISSDLRDYLMLNTTKHNLEAVKQIQSELRQKKTILSIVTLDSRIARFVNLSIPDVSFFLHEIDTIDNAACTWLTLMAGINLNVFKGFSQEYELVDFFLTKQYHQNVSAIAGVVFDNVKANQSLPTHIRYKIRQNATFTPTTKRVRDRYWYPGPGSGDYKYYNFGFLWVQDIIERAIISVQVGRDVVEPGSYLHRMPYPCWLYDRFVFMIEHVMPLCLTISWVYSVAMLVQSIVYEKEQRLKEVMKMMGLSNAVHWLAWFITTFIQFSVTMGVLTAMLKYGHVLTHSNPVIVFTTLEVFAIATISFCFLISTLYSKAKVAAACAGIVYFLTYVPYMYVAIKEDVAGDSISSIVKTLVSLFSTTAFGLGGKYFAFYEEEGVGVQWNNIYISPVEDDQFNLLMVLLMMIFDAFVYAIIAWYIENVFPGSYGLPKPWYFPFTKTYWCGGQSKAHDHDCSSLFDLCRRRNNVYSLMEEDQAGAMARNPEYASNFEAEPSHLARGVCIDNLTKVYKTGKKLAVKNLSLNLYEEQITSFLGHNGAGKTTTMSILTGLFPPTSGSATVYGHDIRTDMEFIRQGLGMCPQHNVLFDKLTVEEHLWFYARLKGMKTSDINTEMDTMFEDLGLPKKRKSRVDCLSGGMQRKLSVAIAFVGGSRTVILDEPTAGVDPYARRAIWDLLIKYKHGRTILLSTHHMDEADLLGDRIAIISNGELKCCGSSLFLKNTFCEGYHLYLVKKEKEEDIRSLDDGESVESSHHNFTSECKESKVTEFIQKHVLTAYLKSETRRELHYILPYEEARKGNFEKLFQALEAGHNDLHISSHGVADSTLEEVFLQVTETASKDLSEDEEPKPMDNLNLKPEESQNIQPSIPLDELLDEAAGGQPEPPIQPANENRSSELELGSVPKHIADQNVLEMGHITDTNTDHQEENNTNSDREKELDMKNFELLSGKGTHTLSKNWLLLNHFRAVIVKRFHYITRNWKGLFSQILLPALFVSVAMTVALSAPKDEDLPPLELSPSQYFNLTQPVGNYIPYSNEYVSDRSEKYLLDAGPGDLIGTFHLPSELLKSSVAITVALSAPKDEDLPPLELSPSQYFNLTQPVGNYIPYSNEYVSDRSEKYLLDAGPGDLIGTFHLPSGVGATCVLKSAFNSTLDEDIFRNFNVSHHTLQLLSKYYEDGCQRVFVPGIHLENYVPAADIIPNLPDEPGLPPNSHPTYEVPTGRYYPHCTCKTDNTGFACSEDGFSHPPEFRVVTRDILQDITTKKTSRPADEIGDFYMYTTDEYRLHRYGAFSFGTEAKFVPEDFGKDSPTLFRNLAVRGTTWVWYNQKGYHSLPVYLNTLNNAILRANLPKSKGHPAAFGITVINHPMNQTNNILNMDYILQGADVLIAIFIIVAMSFVPASFVVFLVYERSTKAKHLQFVSGLNPVMYWLANYVWDMCNYVIPAFCIVVILLAFQIPAYVSSTNLPAVIALFLLYGWSMTPLMYPASFFFNEPSTAYIFLIVINLFTGITCIVSSFLLEIFSYDRDLDRVHNVLKDVFLMFPNYCLGRGLMDIAFNQYKNEFYFKTGQYGKMQSPFQWDLITRKLVVMSVTGLAFFIITMLCEYRFFIKTRRHRKYANNTVLDEDVDVAAERKRTLRGSGKKDLLRLENLTKVYKTRKLGHHLAVDKLCIGVPAGECFGLLGVNGAGKTTTFKMLTGDLTPTAGDAYLNGYSISKDLFKVQQSLGYCPQFDALFDELTAREHIQLYSRLRGVPPSEEKQVVEWALKKLCLKQYENKTSNTYSGGNKRKLSTAIALIGHPPLIFMDEPTTGMDPHSRRFLWDMILNLIKDGRSVILTSHSMEECEALCTRLAIMVNGKFKCLGSIQHLKNKYGDGYTFSLRLKGPDYDHAQRQAQRFVQRNFPEAVIKECHYNLLQFELQCRNVSLSYAFSKLESAQKDLNVEDYSVSQNNLDNVFINFVKQQVEIVQESDDSQQTAASATARPRRTLAMSTCPVLEEEGIDDEELIREITLTEQQLETEDDDEPLLMFDETGTHLTLLNMDPVT